MMNFTTDCDTCRLRPKCNINIMLNKLASTAPYNKLEHIVRVKCSIYRPHEHEVLIGSDFTTTVHLSKPISVGSCKHGCGFYKFCSAPINFNDFNDFVKCATVTHGLPLTFESMCTCKVEEEIDVE